MSTVSEIKSKANRVTEVKSDINSEASSCYGQVNDSSSWWQGDAAKAFRTGYKELQTDIKSLINKMTSLSSNLNSLSSKVQRADEEKRLAAEAAARAEAQKNASKIIQY
ncbi:WXG100 family type VII secretion target [Paenibacillus sp. D2_2]|uniref:WXG100 family type VII secretion target n=1 Tax=Paenibacillus sp. D2_2 TaxID=3073092 RepID=UPI002815AAB4|nr:WXG100 family type VII secretion target [Paenibacillus sp. D2_2]WMT42045.1 WXG100 family type VII secretion target [Paenibacillus sp. D2_2]